MRSAGVLVGHRRRVQPGVEERVERAAGDLLGEGDEVVGRARCAVVVGDPALQQREERFVAELAAQGVDDDGAAVVALVAEQVLRRRRRPVGSVGELPRREVEVGLPLEDGEPDVVEPQPLGVRGERLVEPEVGPLAGRDGVAEPLVGQLVGQQQVLDVTRRSPPAKSSRENSERPWVSMASPGGLSVNASPYWSSGYGPNSGSKKAIWSSVRSKYGCIRSTSSAQGRRSSAGRRRPVPPSRTS